MTLHDCLHCADTNECSIIVNYTNDYELKFSTSLDDVAMIEIAEDDTVELTNGKETYAINYRDAVVDHWGIS